MRVRRWAWALGAGFVLAGGAFAIACGSDSQGGGVLPGGNDASNDKTTSGDTVKPDTFVDNDSGGGDAGGGDCGTYRIFPNPDAGPFCPNRGADAGSNCATGETCCLYDREAGVPSQCVSGDASACTGPLDAGIGSYWECDEKDDCTAGQHCCLNITPLQDNLCATKYFSTSAKGTICKTACAAGEAELCGRQADCTTGTCTAARIKVVKQLGFCKP